MTARVDVARAALLEVGRADLAAEVQRSAPGHVEEYAAAEQLLRLRINEWESKR